MKKIISLIIIAGFILVGCSTNNTELNNAIYNSENMTTGSIQTNFKYSTDFGNVEVGGDVTGTLKLTYGETINLVTGNVTINDNADEFTYYENNNKVYSLDEDGNKVEETIAPFFTQVIDINTLTTDEVEAESTELEIGDTTVTTDAYTIELENTLTGEQATTIFEVIAKLGFISSDVLAAETIPGKITIVFYVNPETGELLQEKVTYSNSEVEDKTSTTNIELETTYNYEAETFEVPSEINEE